MDYLEVLSVQNSLSKDPDKLKLAVETNAVAGQLVFLIFDASGLVNISVQEAQLQSIANYFLDIQSIAPGNYTLYVLGQSVQYAQTTFTKL